MHCEWTHCESRTEREPAARRGRGRDARVAVRIRFPISVGRVCGARVSAVWLGDSLEVVSLTLEPSELEDEPLARARTLEFLREIEES
ncbi:MAG: hypothetical protein HC933_13960 [Pleurocapsa sp. SU_196_0]|nr:hypothetical protein [Pleurocapsa sp. SU_196_0]